MTTSDLYSNYPPIDSTSKDKSLLLQLFEDNNYKNVSWLIDCDFKPDKEFLAKLMRTINFTSEIKQILKKCSSYLCRSDKMKLSTRLEYADYCSTVGDHFILSDKDKINLHGYIFYSHIKNDCSIDKSLACIQSKAIPHIVLTLSKFLPMDMIEFEIIDKLKYIAPKIEREPWYTRITSNGDLYTECAMRVRITPIGFGSSFDAIDAVNQMIPLIPINPIDPIIETTPIVPPKQRSKRSKMLYPKIKNRPMSKPKPNKRQSHR